MIIQDKDSNKIVKIIILINYKSDCSRLNKCTHKWIKK